VFLGIERGHPGLRVVFEMNAYEPLEAKRIALIRAQKEGTFLGGLDGVNHLCPGFFSQKKKNQLSSS
jgi:hypothetical protein